MKLLLISGFEFEDTYSRGHSTPARRPVMHRSDVSLELREAEIRANSGGGDRGSVLVVAGAVLEPPGRATKDVVRKTMHGFVDATDGELEALRSSGYTIADWRSISLRDFLWSTTGWL